MHLQWKGAALSAALCFGLLQTASASSFSALYVFGDSLSDAGNVHAALGIPTAPYSNGRFSNGNIWAQDLAASLGLGTVGPSFIPGGTDYAVGSGQSGITPVNPLPGSLADLNNQIASFHMDHPVADPNALYAVWIGSNDIRAILGAANPANYAADAAAVVANIDSSLTTLASYGAHNVLLLTVPDLGKTPAAIAAGPGVQAAASALSGLFDQTLVNGFAPLSLPSLAALGAADGLNLTVLDTYSLVDALVANGPAYGFTDVTTPCVTGAVDYVGGTACSPDLAIQNQHLFWDDIHPTAAGHAIVAQAAFSVLAPEPATITGAAFGLLTLCLIARRRKQV